MDGRRAGFGEMAGWDGRDGEQGDACLGALLELMSFVVFGGRGGDGDSCCAHGWKGSLGLSGIPGLELRTEECEVID